jgi:tetratricopeptide (TPR) repeat protein
MHDQNPEMTQPNRSKLWKDYGIRRLLQRLKPDRSSVPPVVLFSYVFFISFRDDQETKRKTRDSLELCLQKIGKTEGKFRFIVEELMALLEWESKSYQAALDRVLWTMPILKARSNNIFVKEFMPIQMNFLMACYNGLKQHQKVIELGFEALEKYEGSRAFRWFSLLKPELLNKVADALKGAGKGEQAVDYYTRLMEIYESSGQKMLHATRALAGARGVALHLYEKGQHDEALRILNAWEEKLDKLKECTSDSVELQWKCYPTLETLLWYRSLRWAKITIIYDPPSLSNFDRVKAKEELRSYLRETCTKFKGARCQSDCNLARKYAYKLTPSRVYRAERKSAITFVLDFFKIFKEIHDNLECSQQHPSYDLAQLFELKAYIYAMNHLNNDAIAFYRRAITEIDMLPSNKLTPTQLYNLAFYSCELASQSYLQKQTKDACVAIRRAMEHSKSVPENYPEKDKLDERIGYRYWKYRCVLWRTTEGDFEISSVSESEIANEDRSPSPLHQSLRSRRSLNDLQVFQNNARTGDNQSVHDAASNGEAIVSAGRTVNDGFSRTLGALLGQEIDYSNASKVVKACICPEGKGCKSAVVSIFPSS